MVFVKYGRALVVENQIGEPVKEPKPYELDHSYLKNVYMYGKENYSKREISLQFIKS